LAAQGYHAMCGATQLFPSMAVARHAAATAAPKVRQRSSAPQVWRDFVLEVGVAAFHTNQAAAAEPVAAAVCGRLACAVNQTPASLSVAARCMWAGNQTATLNQITLELGSSCLVPP
jgi:Na+/serine symporter